MAFPLSLLLLLLFMGRGGLAHTTSVLFVTRDDLFGSRLMRGVQMAHALNETAPIGVTANCMTRSELRRSVFPKGSVRMCVFVKFVPDGADVAPCRQAGATLVCDGVDSLTPDKNRVLSLTYLDTFIVSNALERLQGLAESRGADVVAIPHHHTNFRGWVHATPEAPVRTVGWQGGRANRLDSSIRRRLEAHCHARGVQWVEMFYREMVPSSMADLEFESENGFAAVVQNIDIMIIFPPDLHTRASLDKIHRKPTTRGVFALSMGIPTVLFPYYSYLECVTASPYPAFASSLEELLSWVDWLIDSREARVHLSHLGRTLAAHFTAQEVAEGYRLLFQAP